MQIIFKNLKCVFLSLLLGYVGAGTKLKIHLSRSDFGLITFLVGKKGLHVFGSVQLEMWKLIFTFGAVLQQDSTKMNFFISRQTQLLFGHLGSWDKEKFRGKFNFSVSLGGLKTIFWMWKCWLFRSFCFYCVFFTVNEDEKDNIPDWIVLPCFFILFFYSFPYLDNHGICTLDLASTCLA